MPLFYSYRYRPLTTYQVQIYLSGTIRYIEIYQTKKSNRTLEHLLSLWIMNSYTTLRGEFMFLTSCLYPFSISLLAVLWLFFNSSCPCQSTENKLTNDQITKTLKSLKQQNMSIFSFAMFIPSLWIYSSFLNVKGAGDSGLIWLIASTYDSYAQRKYPNQKRWGYMIALLATAGLWIGGFYGLLLGYRIHG